MGQAESMFDQPKPTWHEVPGTRTATRGPSHLHDTKPHYKDGMTLYTNLMELRSQFDDGSRNIFGWRPIDPATGEAGDYEWITYASFLDEVKAMASAMVHELGLTRQAPVGVFSKNRYEWVLVEHGANRMAYQLVPLYDTLGPEAVPFIINQTEMKVIFVGKQQLPMLLKGLAQCPTVATIVQFEDVEDAQKQDALARGVQLKSLREIMEAGKKKPVDADPPLSSDIATICYTSGTTGNPKGAMLTHGNLMCAAIEAFYIVGIVTSDVHMSFLPLPHVLERAVQNVYIAAGASIGFYQAKLASCSTISRRSSLHRWLPCHACLVASMTASWLVWNRPVGTRSGSLSERTNPRSATSPMGTSPMLCGITSSLATCVNSLAVAFA